jgi:hypothetical protein
MFSKYPFHGGIGFMGVLQEDILKRISGEMTLQIVLNASSIRFRYLDFSMADVGYVSMFMVNL